MINLFLLKKGKLSVNKESIEPFLVKEGIHVNMFCCWHFIPIF